MDLDLAILLSDRHLRRLRAGSGHDPLVERLRVRFTPLGVRPVFVSAASVDTVTGEADSLEYSPASEALPLARRRPIPRLIYNHLVRPGPAESRALRALNGDSRYVLFNETNRWRREMLLNLLSTEATLTDLLPQTLEPRTAALPGTGVLLFAPFRGPAARGGCLLELEDRYVRYHPLGGGMGGRIHRDTLPELLGSLAVNRSVIQSLSGLPDGPGRQPAEWRLYLQRSDDLLWEVAGTAAKCDTLRGDGPARCWPFDHALSLTFGAESPVLGVRLRTAGQRIAETIGRFLPGIAHCALDFWIDRSGRPQVADVLGSFRIDWLRRAGDRQGYDRVAAHPARFAATLSRLGVGKLHVG